MSTDEVKDTVKQPRWKRSSSVTLNDTETGTKLLHIKYDRDAMLACKNPDVIVVSLRKFANVLTDLACELSDAALEASK